MFEKHKFEDLLKMKKDAAAEIEKRSNDLAQNSWAEIKAIHPFDSRTPLSAFISELATQGYTVRLER